MTMAFNPRSLSTVSLALLAALSSATPLFRTLDTRDSTCATGLHVMIGGGCDEPCASDVPGYLNTTVTAVTDAFPGSDTYYVPYDSSETQAAVSTPLMIAAANAYFAQCPDTPVVFLGYSMGAIITMGTLCGGLSASNTGNVLAAIAYGDETWTYPQTYDYGTCKANAPKYTRANAAAACANYAPILRSYCDAEDPACCTGGNNTDAHFTYPDIYNADALAFIKEKYAERYGNSTSTSSSVTAASTITLASSSSAAYFPTTGESTKTALASITSGVATVTSTSASTTIQTPSTSTSTSISTSTSAATSHSTTSSTATAASTSSSTGTTQTTSHTGAAAGLTIQTGVPVLVGAAVVAAFMGM